MDAAFINAVPSPVPMELADLYCAAVAVVGATSGPPAGVTSKALQAALDGVSPAKQARWAKLQASLAAKGLELTPTPVGIYIVKRSLTGRPRNNLIRGSKCTPAGEASL